MTEAGARFELPRLIRIEPTVLGAPAIVGVLADADLPDRRCNSLTVGDGHSYLAEFVQDLLRRVSHAGGCSTAFQTSSSTTFAWIRFMG